MFGRNKKDDVGLLVKDVLVDLESNPKRADEMIEKMGKGENPTSNLDFLLVDQPFITATAIASPMRSQLEMAMRQAQMAAMQNQQFQGGLGNGFNNQSLGNALGGLGGLLGPSR